MRTEAEIRVATDRLRQIYGQLFKVDNADIARPLYCMRLALDWATGKDNAFSQVLADFGARVDQPAGRQ